MSEPGPPSDDAPRPPQAAIATDLPPPEPSAVATDLPPPEPSAIATDLPPPEPSAIATDLPPPEPSVVATDLPPGRRAAVLTSSRRSGEPSERGRRRRRDPDAFSEDLLRGTIRLDRYRVTGTLGRGAMGTVLEARDDELDREVAIKVLHPDVARRNEDRLRQEAQALAQLTHPNVIQVYGSGTSEGRLFIVMELVRGQTLRAWQESGPPKPWATLVEAYVQAGEGLAAAHRAGLVHRDFNPGNCIRDEAGRVRVLDFGLARGASSRSSTDASSPDAADDDTGEGSSVLQRRLTRAGAVLGTLAYMPFERLQGKDADARSDQFGFCVSLYEALYGHRPFEGDGAYALILALERGQIRPPPPDTRVPRRLRRVLLRGLSLRPEDRWPTMDALLEALARATSTRGARPLVLVGAGALSLTALALALAPGSSPACADPSERLAGVWDDEARSRVERAVLDTETAYAADTWERLAPRLDAYAEAWAAGYTDACEATRVRGEQSDAEMDARMRCLDHDLREFRALVEVLETADAKVAETSLSAVAELPPTEECASAESGRPKDEAPEDPQALARLEALRTRLAEVRALDHAGRYADAIEKGRALRRDALALGNGPFTVRAELALGDAFLHDAKREESVEILEPVYFRAKELGMEREALLAATHAMFAYVTRGMLDDAMTWSKHAEAMASRLDDPNASAVLTGRLAILHASRGDLQTAEPLFARSLAYYEDQADAQPINLANALKNQANFLSGRGHPEQAIPILLRSLAIEEEQLGPRHPDLVGTLNNLGAAYYTIGESVTAREMLLRALAIADDSMEPGHPYANKTLDFLANVELSLGDFDAAYEHALLALERRSGPGSRIERSESHSTLAMIALRRGDLETAERENLAAVEILEDLVGPTHPRLITPILYLGEITVRRGQLAESEAYNRRGIQIVSDVYGPDHPHAGSFHVNLGVVHHFLGDHEGAVEEIRRGLAIVAASPEPQSLGHAYYRLAKSLHATGGDLDEVRSLAARSLEELGSDGTAAKDRTTTAEVEAWLETLPPQNASPTSN